MQKIFTLLFISILFPFALLAQLSITAPPDITTLSPKCYLDSDKVDIGTPIITGVVTETHPPAINSYVFTGNGVWQDPQNWEGERIPPNFIHEGDSITIKGSAIIQKDSSMEMFCCDFFNGSSNGVITIAEGGTLDLRMFTQFSNDGTINVYGTLINESAFEASSTGDIHIWGTFINRFNPLVYNRANIGNVGLFVVEDGGTVINESGVFSNDFNDNRGEMILNANGKIINKDQGVMNLADLINNGGTITNSSVLNGNASISGNLTNAGILAPGNSPGTYTITGDYTATSTSVHNFEVAGLSSGSYDALNVTGNVNLGGTLNVIPYNNFSPTTNAEIPIITGTINGTFSNVNLPSNYQLVYNSNSVVLRTMAGALPVTFLNLEAARNGKNVQLIWKVATETNVLKYEVEKSYDGNMFFKIGEKAAARLSKYDFNDAAPSAKCFYRVKSKDINGGITYSSILAYNAIPASGALQAFPSPATNGLTVMHPEARLNSKLILTSIDGKVLQTVLLQTGSQQSGLDISALKAGIYILKFDSANGNNQTIKITKL